MLNAIVLNATTPDDVFSETSEDGLITFTCTLPVKIGNVTSLEAVYKTRLGELKPATKYTLFGILKVDTAPSLEIKWMDDIANPSGDAMMISVGTVRVLEERNSGDNSFLSIKLACKQDEKGDDGYYKSTWVGSTVPKGLAPYVEKGTILAVYGKAKLHESGDKTFLDVSAMQTKLVSSKKEGNGNGSPTPEPEPTRKAPPNPLF